MSGQAGSEGAKPEASPRTTPTRPREPEVTRQRILDAATVEFAKLGLAGARVDAIAARSLANKRMIYHYFGSKEGLYLAVLEDAYAAIRKAEQKLDLARLPPEEALRTLVSFTWNYFLKHPEFLALVTNENLQKARHLKKSAAIREMHTPFIRMVREILDRGVTEGVFRPGVDPVQLNITIAAIGYHYLTNRFTGAIIYDRDLDTRQALDERLAFNIETVLRLVRASVG